MREEHSAVTARSPMQSPHAVIVGAGPYGLSLAAHFREAGIPFRIFGRAMHTWKTQMPVGMKLKSDGFASSLSAGLQSYTLGQFSKETGRAYHDTLIPVPLEDFCAYGEEFARRFVPNLEESYVTHVEREADGFRVELESGETFYTCHVILAMGVGHFQHVPGFLAELPAGLVTHTSEHRTFDEFTGRHVTVIGRGASALNAAVLLTESGAEVTLLSRSRKLHIHHPTSDDRSLYQKLRHPLSPLGVGLRSWLASNVPDLFRILPGPVRRTVVFKHLGPAGGTALQGRIEGQFPAMMGWSISSVDEVNADGPVPQVKLTIAGPEGAKQQIVTSHILAGTGYKVDLMRLTFLSEELRTHIRREPNGAPTLNRYFETSEKNLYFIGPASAASFGPLQRFAAGARYAATRLTAHVRHDMARGTERNQGAVAMPSATQQ